jgi:hypothetical protein
VNVDSHGSLPIFEISATNLSHLFFIPSEARNLSFFAWAQNLDRFARNEKKMPVIPKPVPSYFEGKREHTTRGLPAHRAYRLPVGGALGGLVPIQKTSRQRTLRGVRTWRKAVGFSDFLPIGRV